MNDAAVQLNSRITVSLFPGSRKTLTQFNDSERRPGFAGKAAAISGTVIGFE